MTNNETITSYILKHIYDSICASVGVVAHNVSAKQHNLVQSCTRCKMPEPNGNTSIFCMSNNRVASAKKRTEGEDARGLIYYIYVEYI